MNESLGPQLFEEEDRDYMLRDLPPDAFEIAHEIERDAEVETERALQSMLLRFPNDPCAKFAVMNVAGRRFALYLRLAVSEGFVRHERAREVMNDLATFILGPEQGQTHEEGTPDSHA